MVKNIFKLGLDFKTFFFYNINVIKILKSIKNHIKVLYNIIEEVIYMFGNWTSWDKDSVKRIVKTSLYVDEEETVSLNCEDEFYGDMIEMCKYINSMGIHCAINRSRDSITCSTMPIEQEPHPLHPEDGYYDRIFNITITVS